MTSREHSVIVDPKGFPGSLQELARMLVPLVGQPSSTLVKRLEGGEITIESDLSLNGATQIVNRLKQVGVPAHVTYSMDPLALLDDDGDIEIEEIEEIQFLDYTSETDQVDNPWQSLFPDLDQEGETNLLPPTPTQKKKIPTLGELEHVDPNSEINQKQSTQNIVQLKNTPPLASASTPPAMITPRAPRNAEVMLKDLIPQKKKAPFQPDGFDDTYEHSPELSLLFSLLAPGAGHRYNGEDSEAGTVALSSFFIWPWIQSVKTSFEKGKKIQAYYAPRPKAGALKRALLHLLSFWCIMGVLIGASLVIYDQYLQHSEMERSDQEIAREQILSALFSTKLKLSEARFAGLEEVAAVLATEPRQEISMSEEEHVRRLYAIGVQKCRNKEYAQCQGIMSRVSKLRAGYGDVLKLQTWASVQRTSLQKTPMPDIKAVPSLNEIELNDTKDELFKPQE